MANGIKNIETDIARKIGKVALLTQAEVKRNTPVITGRLRNSIVAVNRGSAEWVIGTNVEYAGKVEVRRNMFLKGSNFAKKKLREEFSN